MYWKYLKYLIKHKASVFKECVKVGLFVHAFTHDLDKFKPVMFKKYAECFYGNNSIQDYQLFDYCWNDHQKRNKHHWQYWVLLEDSGKVIPLDIPVKYIKQMFCDWNSFGNIKEFYEQEKNNIKLSNKTRTIFESMINGESA